MKPYTDAALTIHLNGADLSTAQEIHVTLEQNDRLVDTAEVTATSDGAGGSYIVAEFTQAQTSRLRDDVAVKCQPNWIDANGRRPQPPNPVTIPVGDQLLRRIIYGSRHHDDD